MSVLILTLGDATAQTTKVCSNTPSNDQQIECREGETSTNDIELQLEGIDIDVLIDSHAVDVEHKGMGDIHINVTSSVNEANEVVPSTIDIQAGNQNYGISGNHEGTGTVNITVSSTEISTEGGTGFSSHGIQSRHYGTGQINLDVSNTKIETKGRTASGIYARHHNTSTTEGADANVTIKSSYNEIITEGREAYGIWGTSYGKGDVYITSDSDTITTKDSTSGAPAIVGYHLGEGNIDIDITKGTFTTKGHTILGWHSKKGDIDINVTESTFTANDVGIFGYHTNTGDIDIDVTGGTFTTKNHGILGYHTNTGDIDIDVTGGTFTTNRVGIFGYHTSEGDIDIDVTGATFKTNGLASFGIEAFHGKGNLSPTSNVGDININVRDTVIETTGQHSYGIRGSLTGSGVLWIVARGSQRITTTGQDAHGIVGYHTGTGEDRSINITVGGTVDTQGLNSDGVRVGTVISGIAQRAAAFDGDGYRKHKVTVNGRMSGGSGKAAGIFLGGGGKVFISATGNIGAVSDIAILAAGDTLGANPGDSVIKPKLFVDMVLNGRKISDIIGDDWIINDGGETTIAVNGVILYDGATGVASGVVVSDGVWNVGIRPEGVRILDRSDPSRWVVSEAAKNIVVDRDFSVQDFVRVYAPRAAVYEALPGLVLHLSEVGPTGECDFAASSPSWVRLSGGLGLREAKRASVGAWYDFRYSAVEAGRNVSLGERASGCVSVHSVSASADVSSRVRGGRVGADGIGTALSVALDGPSAYYTEGRFSFTSYDVDFSSDGVRQLRAGITAHTYGLSAEFGKRVALERGRLSPYVRLTGTAVRIDGLTDATGSRVSLRNADRIAISLGVAAAVYPQSWWWESGNLSLRASLALLYILDGAETSIDVASESLFSEVAKRRLTAGVGWTYRRGQFSVNGDIVADGLGSGNARYSGRIILRWSL